VEVIAFLVISRDDAGMDTFIRTGRAAQILGVSRQHVVDLVIRGVLTAHGPGTHRRLEAAEVERLARGGLPREGRQSLWLHHAVAGRVAIDPEGALAKARRNLERMRSTHGSDIPWLRQWKDILDRGPSAVMRVLVAETPAAAELRQNSPFAGVLTDRQRSMALRAFRRSELAARAPAR
jgi:excisionase family DNA binding protein